MTTVNYPALPVLLVDDEPEALNSYELLLHSGGINNLRLCGDSREVLGLLESGPCSALLLDLSMPHLSGEDLIPQVVRAFPEVPIIVLTGANTVETAVRCMRAGVFDYMVKPVEESHLVSGVRRAVELRELQIENTVLTQRMLSNELHRPEAFAHIVTSNASMRSIFQYTEAVAPSAKPLLITGETGVGKELVAAAAHTLSERSGSFVAVNVAGLDDNVFSDTLFGHVRGAFTGADKERKGLIERAAGGTLFLDEIGELSAASQVKLLRVIQEREYTALGSDVAKLTDARIIAATNRSIDDLKASPDFRRDLFFRLQTHHIRVPPLRERLDDIPLLVDHFLEAVARSMDKKKPTPPPELFTLLATYDYPGNVRELESMIHDAVSNHKSRMLSLDTFTTRIKAGRSTKQSADTFVHPAQPMFAACDTLPTLKASNRLLATEAMRRANGNQTIAAQLLGISQSALSRRLKQQQP